MIVELKSKYGKAIDIDEVIENVDYQGKWLDSFSELRICLNALKEYQKLDKENCLLKTNIPLGTIVYICLITEDKEDFTIEQKAFVPGTVYFDVLNANFGNLVFDNIFDAIKLVNDRIGIEKCAENNFPTIDTETNMINDNGSALLTEFAHFDSRVNSEFFENKVIHTEIEIEENDEIKEIEKNDI